MTNTLRKIALQIAIPVLCGLIVVNMYLVSKNLKLIEANAGHRAAASEIQAGISKVLIDLQDMETGQRGYLLTGDAAYLKPFNDARAKLAADFAGVRSKLTGKDRALELQLESLTASKISEMNETIGLRQRGYRHRAFLIVNSNTGKQLMDEARTNLNALAAAQAGNAIRYDQEMNQSIARAGKDSALAGLLLLAVSMVTFVVFHTYRKRLEIGCIQHTEELQATSRKLDLFTSTIFHDIRARVEQMRSYANSLLDAYGGFLPRQGQEKTEHIADGAGQIIHLLDDLSNDSVNGQWEVGADRVQQLSA